MKHFLQANRHKEYTRNNNYYDIKCQFVGQVHLYAGLQTKYTK